MTPVHREMSLHKGTGSAMPGLFYYGWLLDGWLNASGKVKLCTPKLIIYTNLINIFVNIKLVYPGEKSYQSTYLHIEGG